MADSFDLIYVRAQHGWSDLYVVASGNVLAIRITHIFSDPITDLIRFCEDILRGQNECSVTLQDEPGSTVIAASMYPRRKDIIRVGFWACTEQRPKPNDGKLLLELDIEIWQFVGLVFRQLEKISWLFEDKSYSANRGNFPRQDFERFERLVKAANR